LPGYAVRYKGGTAFGGSALREAIEKHGFQEQGQKNMSQRRLSAT
jgi:hypothetical protein